MTASIKEALELKPCPFCGGPATLTGLPNEIVGGVACRNEDCFGPRTTALTKQDSIQQWNTRVTPASLESGEARERIAQIVDAYSRGAFTGWKGNTGDSKITLDEAEDHFTLCMQDLKDAILATGCAPDEASIRADQKERDAKVALIQAKQGATAEQIAAAIRAGRGEG